MVLHILKGRDGVNWGPEVQVHHKALDNIV